MGGISKSFSSWSKKKQEAFLREFAEFQARAAESNGENRTDPSQTGPVIVQNPIVEAPKVVKKRKYADRISSIRSSFNGIEEDIRSTIRRIESVYGVCSFKNCKEPSRFRDNSSLVGRKFCRKHGRIAAKKGGDIVDQLGRPIKGKVPTNDKILFLYLDSWKYDKKPSSLAEFYPGTPVSFSVVFHFKLMNFCFKLARGGMAVNKIWDTICQDYDQAPPEKCYRQFLNVLTEVLAWKTLDHNLIFGKSSESSRSKPEFLISCPCCFGDPKTTKTIILIMDACFTAKRYKKSGESLSNPKLDSLYYLATPTLIRNDVIFEDECSDFRAGDVRLKADKSTDVSAVFAAVCVHGFAYKMIDVSKGEAMGYSTCLVREFKKEFPRAKLVIAYDIACRLKSSIQAAKLKVHKMFVPIMHSFCHNFKCRTQYCPRNILGIGLEDGENAERFWSRLSWNVHFRYMRPENRRDFLSAHVNLICSNVFKSLDSLLKTKLKKATKLALELKNVQPRNYAVVSRQIETENECLNYSEFIYGWSKDRILNRIFDTAAALKRQRLLQGQRKGSKSTALIAKASKSTYSVLDDLIEQYNKRFNTSLNQKFVFDSLKESPYGSQFMKEVQFWKAIEQIVLSRRDIDDAIKSLTILKEKLDKLVLECSDDSFLDLLEKRRCLYKNKLKAFKAIKIDSNSSNYDVLEPFINQVDI